MKNRESRLLLIKDLLSDEDCLLILEMFGFGIGTAAMLTRHIFRIERKNQNEERDN